MEKPKVHQELEEGLCSRVMEKKMMYKSMKEFQNIKRHKEKFRHHSQQGIQQKQEARKAPEKSVSRNDLFKHISHVNNVNNRKQGYF